MKKDRIIELAVRGSSTEEILGLIGDPGMSNRKAKRLAGELYRSGKIQEDGVQSRVQEILSRRKGRNELPSGEPKLLSW